jgi:hypothetical protein
MGRVRSYFAALLGASAVFSCNRQPKADGPATTVTAEKLSDDYEANEVGADQRYKGKTLLVTGPVERVEEGAVHGIDVRLSTSNGNVIAYLLGTERESAGQLERGQSACFRCTGGGKIMWPLLLDCAIVADASAAQAGTAAASTSAVAPAPVASAVGVDAVGVKECDDYIKRWNDCYKGTPQYDAALPQLQQMKQTWAMQAKANPAALARGCKMALDAFPSTSCKRAK